jgi:ribosomal protein L11 methyltransferase
MWQVSIAASAETEEAVAQLFEETFAIPATVYCDARTGKRIVSAYPSSLHLSPRLVRAALLAALRALPRAAIGLRPPRLTVKKLPREDWANSWKRHFKPMEIGRHLLIKPGWSKRRPRPGQRVILLDPGLSFGTGHHATTAFCLEQLAACRRPGTRQSFLDIGTGSGILAIAAAKLGYTLVEAFDFDPESIRVSRQNVKRNRVQSRVHPSRRDLTRLPMQTRRRWNVICANLMAGLLASQAEKICARLQLGGQLIVAGILRSEFRLLRHIFVTLGLTLAEFRVNREWQSGRFVLMPSESE